MKDKEKAVKEEHKRKRERKKGFSYVSQVNIYPFIFLLPVKIISERKAM